eukprot:TRINITY_DN61508_c0_g1_i1.p1 TRINITY_DN61508_c0_g1~~TRINITY_DN61508_c0_g1_i1.p1  ORF type:complete len:165 (-),score=45.17 TRINITY_DN61508_c0_g1_i1:5-499(-)
MMARLIVACLFCAWAVQAAEKQAKAGTQECAEMGYGADLRCSTCSRLQEFLPSGEEKGAAESAKLVSECRRCCESVGEEVFKRGILYVCPSQVQGDQDIEDFVKRKADAFKSLDVKYRDGVRTTLMLLREGETEEDAKEAVNIRGWKSDEIRDFVAMKLGAKLS